MEISDLYPVTTVVMAWISRELIPLYLKSKNVKESKTASKADVKRVEDELASLKTTVVEIRDWMLLKKGEDGAKR